MKADAAIVRTEPKLLCRVGFDILGLGHGFRKTPASRVKADAPNEMMSRSGDLSQGDGDC